MERGFIAPCVGLLIGLITDAPKAHRETAERKSLKLALMSGCTPLPILRLTDGEKRVLQSVHGMWQHERLLIN